MLDGLKGVFGVSLKQMYDEHPDKDFCKKKLGASSDGFIRWDFKTLTLVTRIRCERVDVTISPDVKVKSKSRDIWCTGLL